MARSRHTTRFLVLFLMAVAGYLLISLPPVVIQRYLAAREISPAWGYVYLGTIVLGTFLLSAAVLWLLAVVWRTTREKRRKQERRDRSPSAMNLSDQEQELRENLSVGDQYAAEADVSAEVRAQIRGDVAAIEARWQSETLEIVAFGTISSGKSSLLNALAGRDIFRTDPRGGTTLSRNEIPWAGADRVVLVDTPGLAEVHGEERAAQAAANAKNADLVLFVVDGPLKAYERDLLAQLGAMEKRLLVCLNKDDWYAPQDRENLIGQIRQQCAPFVAPGDVVAVRARHSQRPRVRVLADGSETTEPVNLDPDITVLADRMMAIAGSGRRELLVGNLLLQSRGMVQQSKDRVLASLDARAENIVNRSMWAAGGAAAVNPIPLLDLAGGSAVVVKMVLDLARVYQQSIDADTVVNLLAQLSKNLIGMLGVSAVTPALTSVVASLLKTVPGVGTIAGGIVQGLVQALIARWIGKVFIAYFRAEMTQPPGGLAEVARQQWNEVTRPEQLIKLIQAGRKALRDHDA